MYREPPPLTPNGRKLPEKFGRYMLIERIGSGGMAEVFRAVTFGWEGFRRVLVIKRIRREHSESPNFLSMFFDEAKISALLHHPNIVQVYDFGQADGAYFLAMEHIDGKDLGAVLRALRGARRKLPPSLAAFVGHEMAQGLAYAHALVSADGRAFDIVHRDVNPSNVMLLRTGGVKILDFGIAKASEAAGKTQTQRAMLKGKLSYLSPEQARLEPLDARSDLFSWGSTMWEMLTGHRLFGGQSDFERLEAVKNADIPPPSQRRAGIPEALDRIVVRALERSPARRYATAQEMARDLDEFLKKEPPEPDAVATLLNDLFGDASSRNAMLPMEENSGQVSGPTHTDPSSSQEIPTSVDSYASGSSHPRAPGPAAAAPARRGSALWVAAAALAVTALAAVLWSLRASPVAPRTLPMPTLAPPAGLSGQRGMVAIEVDSEPSGAVVLGSAGRLGVTPFTLQLRGSVESEQLRFEKPGFEPATYDLRPSSAGAVFVRLQREP